MPEVKICAPIAAPRSAPSITARAGAVASAPCATNEQTITAVAVELCTNAAAMVPASAALTRLPVQTPIAVRSDAPKARIMPVRIIRTPHSISATPPRTWMRISVPLKLHPGPAYDDDRIAKEF